MVKTFCLLQENINLKYLQSNNCLFSFCLFQVLENRGKVQLSSRWSESRLNNNQNKPSFLSVFFQHVHNDFYPQMLFSQRVFLFPTTPSVSDHHSCVGSISLWMMMCSVNHGTNRCHLLMDHEEDTRRIHDSIPSYIQSVCVLHMNENTHRAVDTHTHRLETEAAALLWYYFSSLFFTCGGKAEGRTSRNVIFLLNCHKSEEIF